MTLQVSFDQFPATVKRLLNVEIAYVAGHGTGSLITSAKPEKDIVVATTSSLSAEAVASVLKDQGLEVFEGSWRALDEGATPDSPARPPYVAAVSYRSGGDKPGAWVDAYPTLPTPLTVLKAMFEEFRTTGELDDVPFEEFVQVANPNVVIVTPEEVESFLRQKEDC